MEGRFTVYLPTNSHAVADGLLLAQMRCVFLMKIACNAIPGRRNIFDTEIVNLTESIDMTAGKHIL